MKLFPLAAALVIGGAVPATAAEPRVFELRKYTATAGKFDALNARMKQHAVPLFGRHNITLHGAFVPLDNKAGVVYLVVSHESIAARKTSYEGINTDAAFKQATADTDKDGKLLAKVESTVLAATDYSPDVAKFKPADKERVFELRTYLATPDNLDRLNARFRDHTVKLFEKYGMTNVVYMTAVKGEKDADKLLVYLLAHESDAARKKSFDQFRLDPAWVAAKDASEKAGGGSLTVDKIGVQSVVLKATDYSPMK